MRVDERAVARRRRELVDSGVTRAQLESGEWTSPHFGYHRSAQVNDPIRQRIVDAVAVGPDDGVVGGWAAAYLQGVAYLDGGWGHPGPGQTGEPVLVVVPPHRVVKRPGIVTLRATLESGDVVERQGIRCTSGTRTAYDMLRLAGDLTAAVVAGDCLLHAGITRAGALSAYEADHPRRRGVRQLRAALPLLDAGAASPPESRLRLLCRQAGLPPLLVNVPVFDLAGDFLGIVDLLEPFAGLGLEYDGAHHRELAQHTADNRREEGLEANGLAIVRVTSLDLEDERATIGRIQEAHRRRLFRDRAAETWTCRPRLAGVGGGL
ncbi:MAG: hypothetical protein QOF10_6686 [Kribbellaceae bacterium]|nr:hypothetical protein [Kribbellaceae bacterium]